MRTVNAAEDVTLLSIRLHVDFDTIYATARHLSSYVEIMAHRLCVSSSAMSLNAIASTYHTELSKKVDDGRKTRLSEE